MDPAPEYDELHVISDLHIGGTKGFQAFDAVAELSALVRYLRDRPSERSVCLVINGDMIDFLAEPNPCYFGPLDGRRPPDVQQIARTAAVRVIFVAPGRRF